MVVVDSNKVFVSIFVKIVDHVTVSTLSTLTIQLYVYMLLIDQTEAALGCKSLLKNKAAPPIIITIIIVVALSLSGSPNQSYSL